MHDLLHEILTLAQATGDRIGMLYALEHLAYEARLLGKQAEAETKLDAFFALSREIGNVQGQARVHNTLGRQAVSDGDWGQAQHHFLAALPIAHTAHLAANVLDALVGLAMYYRHEGKQDIAMSFTLYVLNHPACTQVVKNRAAQLRAELNPQFTAGSLALIQAQVQAKPVDAVAGELLAAHPLPQA